MDLEAEVDLERANKAAEETPGGTCGTGPRETFRDRDLPVRDSSEETISSAARFRAALDSAMQISGVLNSSTGEVTTGRQET